MDNCSEGLHVGHHHHDVLRLQAGIGIKPSQQLIVQHLHFSQRSVAADYAQTVVFSNRVRDFRRRFQVKQCVLNTLQACRGFVVWPRRNKGLGARHCDAALRGVIKLIEQMQVIAALTAPRGQQVVSLAVQRS